MSIRIDIFARLHEREAQRDADRLADIYENAGVKAGESAGDGITKGLQKASPRIQRELNKVANATAATRKEQAEYTRILNEGAVSQERTAEVSARREEALRRESTSLARVRAEQDAYNRLLKSGNADTERLFTQWDRILVARNKAASETAKAADAEKDYQRAISGGSPDRDRLAAQSDRIAVARRREADAHRSAAAAIRSYVKDARDTDSVIDTLSGNLEALGKTALPVARGMALIAAPAIIAALVDTAKVAVTASQSIYLLPAAATAAAAGMGTLQLATAGFADAIKDIRDPKKFAEGLASLAPNAQQAALEIRQILPELDRLQQATQNAFFDGFGQKIDQLSATFLPGVQKLTTDIATTFNQSLTGIGDLLMTPENQANIGTIMTNIGDGFRAAAPAAKDFAQAFIDITSVGSSFLPGLGNDIATVAREFANFISEARKTGQLQEWIQEGIDAVKSIGTAIWDVGAMIYDVFGKDGKKNVEDFMATAQLTISVMHTLMASIKNVGDFISGNTSYARAFNDAVADWPEAVHAAGNAFVDFANTVKNAILNGPVKAFNAVIQKITEVLNLLPGPDRPLDFGKIPEIPDIPYGPSAGNWDTWDKENGKGPAPQDQVGIANNRYSGPSQQDSGFQRWTDPKSGKVMVLAGPGLWVPEDDPRAQGAAGRPYGGPFDVPAPPEKKDPNAKDWSAPADQWALGSVPIGAFPGVGAPGGMPPGMGGAPGSLPGMPGNMMGPKGPIDPEAAWDAESRMQSAGFRVEETRQRYLELAHDNNTSETDLLKSKHDVAEAERDYISAEMKAAEVAQGKFKTMSSGMNELGAQLDADFGLSEGLPGLAKNITMFVGNLLAAPALMQLQGISNAAEAQGQPTGGFGLLGILGAQNMMQGKSPLFGNPLSTGSGYSVGGPTGVQSATGSGSSGWFPGTGGGEPYGLANGSNSGGYGGTGVKFPPWVNQLGAAFGLKPSTYPGHQEDRGQGNQGIDWQGPVENMQKFAEYLESIKGTPGLEDVIWQNPGTGQKIGVNKGRDVGNPGTADPGYFRDDFADHRNHVHTTQSESLPLPGGAYVGGDGGSAMPGMPGGVTIPGFGGGSLPVPLPVTIVGGMGDGASWFGGAGGAPAAASSGGGGGAPGGGGGGLNWDALAAKESSGNWKTNTGNGFYGGLQFDQNTWKQYGGDKIAPRADLASKEDQIAIAKKAFDARGGGSSLWPKNYGQLGAQGFAGVGGDGGDHRLRDPMIGRGTTAYDPNHPSGGGNINPAFRIDPSTASMDNNPNAGPKWYEGISGPGTGNAVEWASGGMNQGPAGAQGIVGSQWQPSGGAGGGGMLGGITGQMDNVPNISVPLNSGSGVQIGGPPGLPGQGGLQGSLPGPIGGGPMPSNMGPGPLGGGLQGSLPGPIGGAGTSMLGAGNAMAGGAAPGAGVGATGYGGVDPGVAMGGTGGIGASDSTMAMIGMATSALDVMAPGAGQAAQIGIKLANRAIQYGGQLAAIGVGGLMETFLPTGGSELANGGWIPRIAGGLAGAKPALPNIAGGKGGLGGTPADPGAGAPGPLTPQQAQGQTAPPGQGPNITTNITNNNASPDQNAAQADWHAGQMYQGSFR